VPVRLVRAASERVQMTSIVVAAEHDEWCKLKALVLDSVSSPNTRRVYNLALDDFIKWYRHELRHEFSKATVSAWRASLEARPLGSSSINIRLSAIRKLATEASDKWTACAGISGWHPPRKGR